MVEAGKMLLISLSVSLLAGATVTGVAKSAVKSAPVPKAAVALGITDSSFLTVSVVAGAIYHFLLQQLRKKQRLG